MNTWNTKLAMAGLGDVVTDSDGEVILMSPLKYSAWLSANITESDDASWRLLISALSFQI